MSSLETIVTERDKIADELDRVAPGLMTRYRELCVAAKVLAEIKAPAAPVDMPVAHAPDKLNGAGRRRRRLRESPRPDEFDPDSIYAGIIRVLNAFGERGGSLMEVSNATERRPNHVAVALHKLCRWKDVVEHDKRYWHTEFAEVNA